MKVKCNKIYNSITKEDMGNSSPWLTIDKEYIVFDFSVSLKGGISIGILSDDDEYPIFVSLKGFEITSEYVPSNWNAQFDDGVFCMAPKSWMYDSFYEDLCDEEPKAVELFSKELQIMYEEELKFINS